mmetsp:Transcript_19879/g.26218  ORF Transcript_19879/g.26218 Transcript_19879/m.26218 type:complete len:242 (-) Transcript_19879:282-1007(-)
MHFEFLLFCCVTLTLLQTSIGFSSTWYTTKVCNSRHRNKAQLELSPECAEDADSVKNQLLSEIQEKVSSGKGIPTLPFSEQRSVLQYITQLELSAKEFNLIDDIEKLEGKWKLLFTSNNGGVPDSSPLTFNQVFQTISQKENSVKNTVYFNIGGFRDSDFTLDHSYQIISSSRPAKIEITLKKFLIDKSEDEDFQSINVPVLKNIAQLGSGSFEITYIDDQLRISRGNLGKVRVFERILQQ